MCLDLRRRWCRAAGGGFIGGELGCDCDFAGCWDLAAQGVCRRCRGRIRTREWFWAWTRGLAWKTVGGAPENRVQEVTRGRRGLTARVASPLRPVAGKCGAARPVLSCQLSAVSVLATCSGCGSRLFCSRVCRVQVGELSEAPRPGRAPRFRRSRRGAEIQNSIRALLSFLARDAHRRSSCPPLCLPTHVTR